MKLLLFDVDATLILTGGAGLRALERAFKKLLNLDDAMLDIAPHGKTDPGIVREVFQRHLGHVTVDEHVIQEVIGAYVDFLRDEVERSQTYHVLPGIVELLQEMKQRSDVLLGLATGNVESGARIKLQRGGLNGYFAFGGYGSDCEIRADLVREAAARAACHHGASLDPRNTYVIGDTPRDIEAGREAGFRTVGVATGHYSLPQLQQAGPDLAISDFRSSGALFLKYVWG